MKITCSQCGHMLEVPDSRVLTAPRCPQCNRKLVLPAEAKEAPAGEENVPGDAAKEVTPPEEKHLPRQRRPAPSPERLRYLAFWTAYGALILILLLVAPACELRLSLAASEQYAQAIKQAETWLTQDDVEGFEAAYQNVSQMLVHPRFAHERASLEELQQRLLRHRDQLVAEEERRQGEAAFAAGDVLFAERLLVEYVLKRKGERISEARSTLEQIRSDQEPLRKSLFMLLPAQPK